LSVILRVVYDEVFPKVVDVNIIGQMDIDLSYDPQFLPACTQFDVIIRSRYAEGAGLSNWPGYRTTLSLRGGQHLRPHDDRATRQGLHEHLPITAPLDGASA
jgi:hypothetical protein